ncbi:hypothetical protein GCM10025870_31120 [Agromyces marinus]|uniref:Uncharacterized protein n=1 Tax=Agromyces marinus TaxID=1389020 RepID=A0ABM8H5G3_9MICO|nr:hypothetical protein [Agromyces marinus]BDZ56039.1 hypothetical protein GCM10025870_31120 [Agromyces marinus]
MSAAKTAIWARSRAGVRPRRRSAAGAVEPAEDAVGEGGAEVMLLLSFERFGPGGPV